MYLCWYHGDQKRASDPLELQVVVTHPASCKLSCVDSGHQILLLCKSLVSSPNLIVSDTFTYWVNSNPL